MILDKPVYISLTSIFQRQEELAASISSIINQTVKPDRVFLYLSEEPYMLDSGFQYRKITNPHLKSILSANPIIEVIWVENTGSFRKLLPLLKERIDDDCLVITIDDDTCYNKALIETYVTLFDKHECQIGARGCWLKVDLPEGQVIEYGKPPRYNTATINNFNTGKGGILYHPIFFHKFRDIIFDSNKYRYLCETGDDLWFNCMRMSSDIPCYVPKFEYMIRDMHSTHSLWNMFNSLGNLNGINFHRVMKYLSEYKKDVQSRN